LDVTEGKEQVKVEITKRLSCVNHPPSNSRVSNPRRRRRRRRRGLQGHV